MLLEEYTQKTARMTINRSLSNTLRVTPYADPPIEPQNFLSIENIKKGENLWYVRNIKAMDLWQERVDSGREKRGWIEGG